jgi:hypothetical protein
VTIVETKADLDILLGKVLSDPFVVDVVPLDDERHPANSSPSLIFFRFTQHNNDWCLPVNHVDAICFPDVVSDLKESLRLSITKKMVVDKKTAIHMFGRDYDFLDLNIIKYLDDGDPIDLESFHTNAHFFIKSNFREISNANRFIPLYKHARVFSEKLSKISISNDLDWSDNSIGHLNGITVDCFARLERAGLSVDPVRFLQVFGENHRKHIKDGKVFTQYNLFTATGRPSNRFGGINYAALKKVGNERSVFNSRYGDDGMLVLMDYNAFHPRLIAQLANFNLPGNINPYEMLAKYYFNKNTADEEDIATAKIFTFQMLYGGIDKRWEHIPYFAKIQEYIDHRWRFFESNGYIETPRYARKINSHHIQDATPNKLFNYILQAFETEMAVDVLNNLQTYLDGKLTTPVLYTYDSILFDAHKSDGKETIRHIKSIMEGPSEKFPVKVSVGKSYADLRNVDIG